MKKFLVALSAILLASASSHATGFFVGADALFTNSQFKAKNLSTSSGPKNGSVQDSDQLGYGGNVGFRVDVLNLLASAELFYDDLGTSSRNFESNSNAVSNGDSINIKNRYGVKGNVGFAILPRITPFLTYGLTNVNYSSEVLSNRSSLSRSEMTPIYGAGIMFDLPFGVSAKASYDHQQFNMRYAESGSRIRTNIGVARLGVVYHF